jgi:RNA polymerase sigma-70 factor (ECF subfamily)
MKVINLHQEEKEVIELAVDNNRHAQHQIYSKFAPKMLSVCRQYIKDVHLAEDIMITAFMKVFTNLKNFEHKGSFEGWLKSKGKLGGQNKVPRLLNNRTIIDEILAN